MNKPKLPTGKWRNPLTLALVLLLALTLLAVSLLLPYLMHKNNWYPDLTREGLYTMSDELVKELAYLEEDVEIIFCADEDYLFGNSEMRLPYVTCKKLAAANEHIFLRHVNLVKDPHAMDAYKTTEGSKIAWNSIVVAAEGRYKVLSPAAFYGSEDGEYVTYNGEYRIATAILSLTAYKSGGKAYFAVGHGERFYVEGVEGSDDSLSAFYQMLLDLGLKVDVLTLDTLTEVPNDCSLLIMCDPKTDYTLSCDSFEGGGALEMLDAYLSGRNALAVFRNADSPSLPNLDEYLNEWGFAFDYTHVTSKEGSLGGTADALSLDRLISVYPDEETAGMGYAMFSDVINMATPPKTVIANASSMRQSYRDYLITVANNVTRCVSAVFYAPSDAEAKDSEGYPIAPSSSSHWLAAVSAEARLVSGEHEYSYVFAAGSTEMIENRYLGDAAYGNGDVMFSIMRHISRADVYASSSLGGFDINSENYGGKMFAETHLTAGSPNLVYHTMHDYTYYAGVGVGTYILVFLCTLALPLAAVSISGFAVLRKRKNR